jgi:hypothetical protein
MAERITRCGEEGCSFPKGKCSFVQETEDRAKTFQVAEENGLPDINDASKRWGYIVRGLFDKLDESNCVRKAEVGNEMQEIVPDILKPNLTTKVNP